MTLNGVTIQRDPDDPASFIMECKDRAMADDLQSKDKSGEVFEFEDGNYFISRVIPGPKTEGSYSFFVRVK